MNARLTTRLPTPMTSLICLKDGTLWVAPGRVCGIILFTYKETWDTILSIFRTSIKVTLCISPGSNPDPPVCSVTNFTDNYTFYFLDRFSSTQPTLLTRSIFFVNVHVSGISPSSYHRWKFPALHPGTPFVCVSECVPLWVSPTVLTTTSRNIGESSYKQKRTLHQGLSKVCGSSTHVVLHWT